MSAPFSFRRARAETAIAVCLGMVFIALAGLNFHADRTCCGEEPVAESKSAESPAAGSSSDFDAEGNQATKGQILVRVVDSDGNPIGGVKIVRSVWTNQKDFKATQDFSTGVEGRVEVTLPSTLYILRLWASKSGFVTSFTHWENQPEAKRKRVPEEVTIRLKSGTVLGGTVADPDGKPIAGAKMQVFDEHSDMVEGNLKTDAAGRWLIDTAPPGDHEVRVIATHPDYISLHSYFDHMLEKPTPMAELRAQTAITTMQPGVKLTGKITHSDGKPIAGALVIWGDRPYWEHKPQQEVRTDEGGDYRLPPLPAGLMRVTVVAKDWMPQSREVDISQANPSVDFQLQRGKALRIRFIDDAGQPVPNVSVQIDKWRGVESLYNIKHPNVLDSKIPRNANANGRYEWTWAPDDAVAYRISAIGGFAAPEATFTADDKEQEFVLHRLLEISGSVTDAKTGRPIEKFSVMPVLEFNPLLLRVERRATQTQTAGKLALGKLDRTDTAYRVRVEADGYRSAMSDHFRIGDKNTTCDFALEPAPPAAGRVLDEKGEPVRGAKVFLATKSQSYDADDQLDSNFQSVTNERGEFAFPAQFERYAIIVKHDKGYAQTFLKPNETPGDLQLRAWAKVEGHVLQEGKPVPDADVFVRLLSGERFADLPYINDDLYVKTDADGHFEFPRVPPMKCSVGAQLSPWRDFPITSSQNVPVELKPGQQIAFELGGSGTQVVGRVELKGVVADKFNLKWSLNYLLRMQPGVEPTEDLRRLGFDWRRGWNDAWTQSMEGTAYLHTLHHDFVSLTSNGHFTINGVPPGDYELALKIYEHDDPKACLVNAVATKTVKFHISDADAAKPTLDLGTIELETALGPRAGEIVPDFELKTADGPTKQLSDFRGHVVLVDFWAPWCGACLTELPEIHRAIEKHVAGGKLTVLNMALDADSAAVARFAREHKLLGVHGMLGDWNDSAVLKKLGVSSVPASLLIDADGKLIARPQSVAELTAKLQERFAGATASEK